MHDQLGHTVQKIQKYLVYLDLLHYAIFAHPFQINVIVSVIKGLSITPLVLCRKDPADNQVQGNTSRIACTDYNPGNVISTLQEMRRDSDIISE